MVELTDAGKIFLEGSQQTLLQLERTIKETQLAAEGKIGSIIIRRIHCKDLQVLLQP